MNETTPTVDVPQGDPSTLRFAAQRYTSIDQALSGGEIALQQAPLAVNSWQGGASIRYAVVAAEHAAAVRSHRGAIQAARDATDTYADRLEHARSEAREAKRAEKEALDKIAKLKGKIADEQDIQRIATGEITSLSMQLASDTLGGGSGNVAARLQQAETTLRESNERERTLRGQLDDARDDLEQARRKGNHAKTLARNAAVGYAAGMEAAGGVPPVIAALGPPAQSLGGGQRVHLRRPNEIKPGVNGVNDPIPPGHGQTSGMTPLEALGWAVTAGTGGFMNNLEKARDWRRAANKILTHAYNADHKLTPAGYLGGIARAEKGASEAAAAARTAAKGARFLKPLGPLTDVGTGVYDAASGKKGWLRSGIETVGSIGGGVGGGLLAGALGIETGPGAVATGAAGAVGGSAAGRGGASWIADKLGIH
ncbi:MAG TPA: hypothetical protein VH418_00545 [Solirubrobacteraceae bacterium]|jgi:hypothetical protein